MPDAPGMPVSSDGAPTRAMSAAISTAVVGLLHDYTGRGPTKVRTTIGPDTIVVTLRDSLTRAERTLAIDNDGIDAGAAWPWPPSGPAWAPARSRRGRASLPLSASTRRYRLGD